MNLSIYLEMNETNRIEPRKIKVNFKFVICFAKRNEKEIRLAAEQIENEKKNIKINAPPGRYFHLEYQEQIDI